MRKAALLALALACHAVAAKGTHSHVDTAYTERGDAGSALHRRLQTCNPSSWPDLDWYVCGACKALVNWNAYGSTCGGYCSGIGLTCLDGWEERRFHRRLQATETVRTAPRTPRRRPY